MTVMLGLPRATRRTLDDFLRERSPGFDVVRLVLAFLVLVSHTWPLGGFGDEPPSPLTPRYLTLGGFAVAGFFALSGLLVGRSALTRPTGAYTRARAARILPAYWVALAVGGFVVAPLGWIHANGSLSGFFTFDPGGPFSYVLRGMLFPLESPFGVTGVFVTDTPYGLATGASFVNGSLWTLPPEVRCYVVVGVVAVLARRFGSARTIAIAWALSGLMAVLFWTNGARTGFVLDPYADRQLSIFLFVFLSGTLVGLVAHRIRLFGPIPVVAAVVGVIVGLVSLFLSETIASAMLVLILPPIAAVLTPVGRLLRGVDLSYGLYLYAWPVQQLVAMYGLADSPLPFVVISTIVALLLAAASWFIVERPAMRRWRAGSGNRRDKGA